MKVRLHVEFTGIEVAPQSDTDRGMRRTSSVYSQHSGGSGLIGHLTSFVFRKSQDKKPSSGLFRRTACSMQCAVAQTQSARIDTRVYTYSLFFRALDPNIAQGAVSVFRSLARFANWRISAGIIRLCISGLFFSNHPALEVIYDHFPQPTSDCNVRQMVKS